MRPAAIAVVLMLASAPAGAEWRAIDGDTIVDTSTWEKVRIMGVDTPEIHARCQAEYEAAWRAQRFTAAQLAAGPVVLERHRLDRYGRTLAVVRIGGRDLAELLIAAGLGRPYHGERRRGWC